MVHSIVKVHEENSIYIKILVDNQLVCLTNKYDSETVIKAIVNTLKVLKEEYTLSVKYTTGLRITNFDKKK